MNYGRGTCSECGRSVLTLEGRAVRHPAPGQNYDCAGWDELTTQAKPKKSPPPKPAPVIPVVAPRAPEPVKESPSVPRAVATAPSAKKFTPAVDENALRLATLREELDKGVRLDKAVANVNDYMDEHIPRGSIDFEQLADCDCPSLRAAVRRMLGRDEADK